MGETVNFSELDAFLTSYQPADGRHTLAKHHAERLSRSAVLPKVASERGYFTETTKARLEEMGLQRYPGLVIPIHGVSGRVDDEVHIHSVLRPDEPPPGVGKYLNPAKRKAIIDVPPRVRAQLGDVTVPLVITEGPIKADAAASEGLCCIALLGVSMWKRDGEPLPDWRKIALGGRDAVIAFDSDVMTKPEVHQQMVGLSEMLTGKGANVRYAYLPDAEDGAKLGLDDWLAHGHTLAEFWALVSDRLRAPDDKRYEDVPDEALSEILDELVSWFDEHVAYSNPDHHLSVVALWVAHTHLMDRAVSTPRLGFFSPAPGSGKTRNLELLQHVVRSPMFETSISASALYRSIERFHPTILLDEVDRVFGDRDEANQLLVAVLNAGHRRGATVTRCVTIEGEIEPVQFECFAPKALAGLKADMLPDTVKTRTIIVPMRRRAPSESVTPYRERTTPGEGRALRRRLEAWASRHEAEVPDEPAQVPDSVTDRVQDCWEPLLAIAEAAGDEWAERARAACLAMVPNGDDMSEETQLLTDIKGIFDQVLPYVSMFTRDICAVLHAMDDRPWFSFNGKGPITGSSLAKVLRGYDIKPKKLRRDAEVLMGYEREAFEETWRRYLSPSPLAPSVEPEQPEQPEQSS